jgi:hypothetical protein
MLYLADSDLVLEGIINRPKYALDAVDFWKRAEIFQQIQKEDSIYITNIGFDKIRSTVKNFISSEEKVEVIMSSLKECFQIFPVDRDTLLKAREFELISPDFESAIESTCAEKIAEETCESDSNYVEKRHSVVIITNRYQDFQLSETELPSKVKFKVIKPQYFIKCAEVDDLFRESLKLPSNYDLDFPCYNLVNYYVRFAEEYGGLDWGYYAERFDRIEDEWLIFQKVLNYCAERASTNQYYYDHFKSLCKSLSRFCDLYQHQQDRIKWLTKLKELSSKYELWDDYFFASTRTAWALIMIRSFKKAKQELKCAEQKIDYVENIDPKSLGYFYHCLVTYHVRKKEWEKAQKAIDKQFEYYQKVACKSPQNEDRDLLRESINVRRSIAKRLYRKAWFDANKAITPAIDTEQKDRIVGETISILYQSLEYFNTCLEDSISIDWQRGVSYFYNQIANVKLYLAHFAKEESNEREKLMQEAHELLTTGLKIAVRNKNYRRIACYYESESLLNYLQGDIQKGNAAMNRSDYFATMIGEGGNGGYLHELSKRPQTQNSDKIVR